MALWQGRYRGERSNILFATFALPELIPFLVYAYPFHQRPTPLQLPRMLPQIS